jgi:hypothetical protein
MILLLISDVYFAMPVNFDRSGMAFMITLRRSKHPPQRILDREHLLLAYERE